MTADNTDYLGQPERGGALSVEDVARSQGVSTVATVEDLASDEIFESDEELAEFLGFVREQRNASLA